MSAGNPTRVNCTTDALVNYPSTRFWILFSNWQLCFLRALRLCLVIMTDGKTFFKKPNVKRKYIVKELFRKYNFLSLCPNNDIERSISSCGVGGIVLRIAAFQAVDAGSMARPTHHGPRQFGSFRIFLLSHCVIYLFIYLFIFWASFCLKQSCFSCARSKFDTLTIVRQSKDSSRFASCY